MLNTAYAQTTRASAPRPQVEVMKYQRWPTHRMTVRRISWVFARFSKTALPTSLGRAPSIRAISQAVISFLTANITPSEASAGAQAIRGARSKASAASSTTPVSAMITPPRSWVSRQYPAAKPASRPNRNPRRPLPSENRPCKSS
ncbi:hypothetical protein [Streptomyces subrutilus]|uniref:hypothetical protein n=1 Tax=Streptomyces subrutilus TaxID=36818 RepID=UPI0033EF8743